MKKNIPGQVTGKQKDVLETRLAGNKAEAVRLFESSVRKLLDVNRWAEWAGPFSAIFQLTDNKGVPVQEMAKEGLYIRIDIPGPGTKTGKGYDWVRIEESTYEEDVNAEKAYQLIRARPSNDPAHPRGIAHFFDSTATSTFIVSREGLSVSAGIHGRNEKTSHDGPLMDKLRNKIVSQASMAGVSDKQWDSLAKGLLDL